jgi:hypothetical protein
MDIDARTQPVEPIAAVGGAASDGAASDRAASNRAAPCFILTGMHRSGTSLLGRFLQKSGVDVGDELLGPHPSNPHGHYEDVQVLEFHRRVLKRQFAGEEQWIWSAPTTTDDDRRAAAELVAARRQKGRPWGFKEPRTCLFLDFWRELVPEARFLFVFREPSAVVDSAARRRGLEPGERIWNERFLRAWIYYNQCILRFYKQHRQQCVLFSLNRAVSDASGLVKLLSKRFGYAFAVEPFAASLDAELLSRSPTSRRDTSLNGRMRAAWLHARLNAASDL